MVGVLIHQYLQQFHCVPKVSSSLQWSCLLETQQKLKKIEKYFVKAKLFTKKLNIFVILQLTSISRCTRLNQGFPVTLCFRTLGSNIALSSRGRVVERDVGTSVSVRSNRRWGREAIVTIHGLGKSATELLLLTSS